MKKQELKDLIKECIVELENEKTLKTEFFNFKKTKTIDDLKVGDVIEFPKHKFESKVTRVNDNSIEYDNSKNKNFPGLISKHALENYIKDGYIVLK